MPLEIKDEKRMIDYLLGRLPPEERAAVEKAYFLDDEMFENLQALEDELIRDYLHGDLAADRKHDFERRYLSNAELRAKVEQYRVMDAALAPAPVEQRAPSTESRALRDRIAGLFRMPALAAAVSVASIAAAVWFGTQNARLREDVLRLERQVASAGQRTPSVAAFLLSPGLVRSEGGGQRRLVIPEEIDQVRLELDLAGSGEHSRYRATVRTVDGREVTSQDAAISGGKIAIMLPRASLPPNDYLASLSGSGTGGEWEEVESYSFRVTRQ